MSPLVILGGLTLVAALPRVAGAFDAFWLDEIWSLQLAGSTRSALEVFTALHHDNNHYLNTLWMRTLGGDAPWVLYRTPAVLAGVATVFLAGWIEHRRGLGEGVLVTLLFAVSYPLVHYASEARGYGMVVLLALACYALLERQHRIGDARSAVLFSLVASIGFLAHLTFLTVYLPLLAWSVWVTVLRRDSLRRAARTALAHLPPLTVLALLVMVDVRYLVRGGGPELPPLEGWLEAWAYTLGLPLGGPWGIVLGLVFVSVVLAGLWESGRPEQGVWVFFGLVLVFPVGLLLALRTGYAPPRYFLVSLVFGLLLVGRGLALMMRHGTGMRVLASVLIAVAVVGNGWRVARFLDIGRGQYRDVVDYLATHAEGDTIRIASDYDFGTSMVLGYYERFLPEEVVVTYVPEGDGAGAPVEWYLVHELGDRFDPPEVFELDRDGPSGQGRYVLQATFPKFGLSGWNWALYHR